MIKDRARLVNGIFLFIATPVFYRLLQVRYPVLAFWSATTLVVAGVILCGKSFQSPNVQAFISPFSNLPVKQRIKALNRCELLFLLCWSFYMFKIYTNATAVAASKHVIWISGVAGFVEVYGLWPVLSVIGIFGAAVIVAIRKERRALERTI